PTSYRLITNPCSNPPFYCGTLLGGLVGEGEVAVEEFFETCKNTLFFGCVSAVGTEAGYRGEDFGDCGACCSYLAITEGSSDEIFRGFHVQILLTNDGLQFGFAAAFYICFPFFV